MTQAARYRLRGITWKHTRGLLPMLATAQRFEELHPEVQITWETRSLQAFADEPLESLAQRYDLLVIDHPSCGRASAGGFLLPLEEHLPHDFLRDQEENSVGHSYDSYLLDGHLWALPIDAAAPISLCRSDLLARSGGALPQSWDDLMDLAAAGLVVVPGLAIDSLMHFFMLCAALGEEPCLAPDRVVRAAVGEQAIRMIRTLLQRCPPQCLSANPIAVWNQLASGDSAAYCPFAYGYSNYSRAGYGDYLVEGGELIFVNGQPLRSTLGGAGLAVSRSCRDFAPALEYAQYIASPRCQSTLYFDAGGQPGHRAAWLDPEVNHRSARFFERTLPVLDRAWVRPRYDGFLQFQHDAADLLHAYLREGGSESSVMTSLNRLAADQAAARGRVSA